MEHNWGPNDRAQCLYASNYGHLRQHDSLMRAMLACDCIANSGISKTTVRAANCLIRPSLQVQAQPQKKRQAAARAAYTK